MNETDANKLHDFITNNLGIKLNKREKLVMTSLF